MMTFILENGASLRAYDHINNANNVWYDCVPHRYDQNSIAFLSVLL